RGLQASAGLLSFQAKSEIDAVLRRGLHSRERPPWRDERDIRLARLDDDFTEPGRGVDDGVEDRPELRTIRVLPIDELIGGGEEELRITEALHNEKGLRVAGDTLFCQPGTQALRIVQALLLDAAVPCVHVLAGALLE